MSGVKLYELSAARDILDQFFQEEDGVETPEIADLFAQLTGEIDRKVEDTALWIKEREAEAAAIKLEEQRLAARRKVLENRADRTKRYLELQLEQLGRDKVNGLLVTVSLQTNPPALVGQPDQNQLVALHTYGGTAALCNCVKFVPAAYVLDRAAALRLLKDGDAVTIKDLEGVGLSTTRSRSLRIR